MPEKPPKLPQAEAELDEPGELRAAWFGGMIEGPRGSDEALQKALTQLNQVQLARVDLELDARQFSVLVDDRPLDAQQWKGERLEAFVEHLQALISAAQAPQRVESNMRCVELYEKRVVETLFAVIHGKLHCTSQVRAPRPSDEELLRRYDQGLGIRRMGWGKRLALFFGASLLAASVGWRIGLDDLFFPAEASELRLNTGYFGELLEMRVEPVFGGYEVTLKRGARYPRSAADHLALAQDTEPLSRHVATQAVGSGGELFVRVLDQDGQPLASSALYLEALLDNETAELSITLPGFRSAKGLELSPHRGNLKR